VFDDFVAPGGAVEILEFVEFFLDFPEEKFNELQNFDGAAWRHEVIEHEELFILLHDHLPSEMVYERELLICRL
jgi:phosphoenolpyruvate carboxykinase (GTP)